jgi:serine/threonine protein kinase
MSGSNPDKGQSSRPAESSRETIPPGAAPAPANRETILPSSSAPPPATQRETILPGQADSIAEAAPATGSGIPQEFGRYRLKECLGQGAMGAVYKAHDTQLDRLVALKVPKFDVADSALLERFYREARSAATLSHPSICPVHDVGEIGGIHYISMGYLEGKPLSAFVRPEKPLTEKQAVMIIRKLAIALTEAHGNGIIHRDLKPDNVMIDRKSNPVIMDFGLARRSAGADDIRVTQGGQMLGTPAYMSPEQAEGDVNQMGPRCDIYSLGVILYELLTGRLPYEGSIASVLAQIMKGQPKPPSELRSNLNPELQSICLKMMAANQDDRYASMTEVARDLTAFVKGTPTSVRNSAAPTANETPRPAAIPPAGFSTGDAGLSQLVAVEDVPVSARTSRKSRLRKPAPDSAPPSKTSPPPWAIWSGAAAGALVILLAGYVLFVRVGEQIVRIEIDDPKAQVFVDGDKVQIKNLGATIELTPGKHGVEIRRGDIVVKADSFTVLDGINPVLQLDVLKKQKTKPGESVAASSTSTGQPTVPASSPSSRANSRRATVPQLEIPEAFANSTDSQKQALGFLLSRGVLVELAYWRGDEFLKSKFVRRFEDVEPGEFRVVRVTPNSQTVIKGHEWKFVKSLPHLSTAHFMCEGVDDAALAYLKGHPSLGLLQVNVEGVTDAGLAVVATLPELHTLNLNRRREPGGHRVTDALIENIVRIPLLTKLAITDSDISDAGLARLASAANPAFQRLNLSGSKITDQGVVHLGKMPQLMFLTLSKCQVGDSLAPVLSTMTELQHLNLSGTNAGDVVLKSIGNHQKMRSLDLGGTPVTDAGVAHLRRMFRLEFLNLGKTQVTDNCLATIAQMRSLNSVNLYDCNVTKQAAQEVQKTRPRLKINSQFKGTAQASTSTTVSKPADLLALSDDMPDAYRNSTDPNVRLLGWLIDRGFTANVLVDGRKRMRSSALREAPPRGAVSITEVTASRRTRIEGEEWSFLRLLPRLYRFSCTGPHFDDNAMANLAGHPILTSIVLFDTSVSDEGLQHLSSIRKLYLIHISRPMTDPGKRPPITDVTMSHLAQLPNLITMKGRISV